MYIDVYVKLVEFVQKYNNTHIHTHTQVYRTLNLTNFRTFLHDLKTAHCNLKVTSEKLLFSSFTFSIRLSFFFTRCVIRTTGTHWFSQSGDTCKFYFLIIYTMCFFFCSLLLFLFFYFGFLKQ